MRNSKNLAVGAVVLALSVGIYLVVSAFSRPSPQVDYTDFSRVITPTAPAYRAAVAPASDAPVKEFRIPVVDTTLTIAPGVTYSGWTFGGTVPGPVLRVRAGDLVKVRVVNDGTIPHSIDFHAARIPWDVAYHSINPGDSISFQFVPHTPGAFLVHCGTPPVTMHIMQGMFLAIIVDPKDGWPTKADKEFVLVQNEFYAEPTTPNAPEGPDWQAAMDKAASFVVFNGSAFQYKMHPLQVDVGDRVRFFVVNAGPNFTSDFHIVGNIFDRVYPDGQPERPLEGVQTWAVPPGGGAVFETTFAKDESGAGLYPFVTHAFTDADKGAMGFIRVGPPQQPVARAH